MLLLAWWTEQPKELIWIDFPEFLDLLEFHQCWFEEEGLEILLRNLLT